MRTDIDRPVVPGPLHRSGDTADFIGAGDPGLRDWQLLIGDRNGGLPRQRFAILQYAICDGSITLAGAFGRKRDPCNRGRCGPRTFARDGDSDG